VAEELDEGEPCANCRLPEDKHKGDPDKTAAFLALLGCPGYTVRKKSRLPGQPAGQLCTRCLQRGHSRAECKN
jgi:hypothetical protein